MLYMIASVLLPVVEYGVAFLFFERSYPKRKLSVWKVVIEAGIITVLLTVNIGNRTYFGVPFTFLMVLSNIIIYTISIQLIIKVKWSRNFFFCLFYCALTGLLEFIGIVVQIVMEHKPFWRILKDNSNSFYGIYLLGLCLCILIGVVVLLKYKAEVIPTIMNIHIFYIAIIGGLIFGLVWYYLSVSMRIIDSYLLTGVIFSLVFAVVTIMLVLLGFSYNKMKLEKEHLEIRNNVVSERIQMLEQMEHQRLKQEHDYKHYIRLLEMLGEKNVSIDAETYLRELQTMSTENQYISYTTHTIIDMILNQKKKEADKKGILFECQCHTVKCSMDKNDLCVVLYNILDNAFEAAESVNAGQGFVKVEIMSMYDMFLLKVSNSFMQQPEVSHGRFITTKENKLYHGYGIESVRDIVDKYHGDINIEIGDCLFEIKVILQNRRGE